MKTLTHLVLAAAAAMPTGCTIQYVETKPPIKVHSGFPFQVFRNIEQEDVERQLVEEARVAQVEDTWIYDPDQKILWESGYEERPGSVRSRAYLPGFGAKRKLIFYHIHPLNSIRFFVEKKEDFKKHKLVLETTHAIHAVPTAKDTGSHVISAKNEDELDIETRIVDYQGVLILNVKKSLEMDSGDIENFTALAHSTAFAYRSFVITYKQAVQEFRDIGVDMTYTNLNVPGLSFKVKEGVTFTMSGERLYSFKFETNNEVSRK